jgi:two-component system sensor histidine kinase YesM
MRLFAKLSIRGKLLLILGVIFIIAMLLGLAWSKKSMEAIEANAIEYSLQIVQQTNDRLDSYFNEIERLSLPMLSNKLTLDFLTDSGSDPYDRYITADTIESELFPAIMLNRPDIYAVSLVSDKNLASSSISYMSAEERYTEYRSRIPIIGRFQVMGLQKVMSGDKFTMAMRFVDARSSITTGMLIIDLNMDQIVDICKGIHLGKTGFIWMADPNGKIIYHPDGNMIAGNVPASYLQHFAGERSGYYVTVTPQGKAGHPSQIYSAVLPLT